MRPTTAIVFLCAAAMPFAAFPQALPTTGSLVIQSPAKIEETRKCEGNTCKIETVRLLVSGPQAAGPLRVSVTGFDNNGGAAQTISVVPDKIELGESGVQAVPLQISMPSSLAVKFSGVLAVSSGTGAVATIPVIIQDPVTPTPPSGPSKQTLVEDLMLTSMTCGVGLVVAIAAVLGIISKSAQFLFIKMGRASWDISSWASSGTIAATLATTLLGIPGGLGITKFSWRYEYSVVSALALLLTTVSPVLFNLTRHYTGKPPSKAIAVNYVFAFLISAAGTITATAASWLTLWYANADLVKEKTISAGVGGSIEAGLVVLAGALAVYFAFSIVQTVAVQNELGASAQAVQAVALEALPDEARKIVEAAKAVVKSNPSAAKPWSVL